MVGERQHKLFEKDIEIFVEYDKDENKFIIKNLKSVKLEATKLDN